MSFRPPTSPDNIRNIALVGQGYSGKTTLLERLLLTAGVIKSMGTVEAGNTVSDWSDEEKHHKHSLNSSIVHFDWPPTNKHLLNLIDTPGQADFLGQAIAAMPAVETVAVVVDAMKGVESTTRRLMNIAKDRGIPRLVIINKIDAPDADLPELVKQIRESFGPECLPINLPSGGGKKVINVFDHDGSDSEGDATDFSSVHEAHKRIIEQIVEVEERLMETYLEKGESFSPDELHAAFEKCLEQAHLVPIDRKSVV